MKSTIQIPNGGHHQIVIPIAIWNALDLHAGSIIEIDIDVVRNAYASGGCGHAV